MACEISRPTPQALFDRQRDMFSTTVLNGSPVIPESNEWYVVSLNYAVAEEFYAYSEQQWKEQDPRYACCENLITLAERDGVYPYAASFAQGYVELTGTVGSPLPDVIEVTIAGSTYISVSPLPATFPDPDTYGPFVVRVRAETSGQQGNGNVPSTGQLATAIPGVNNTVQVFGGFCGGEDAETCEQFRSRYLDRKQFKPKATSSWIEQKLLEWPCVTRVCARGGTCGGTLGPSASTCSPVLGFHVFMDNSFPCGIPPQCVIDEITTWMFGPEGAEGYGLGQVEVGVCGAVYPTHPVNISLTVSDYGCITNTQKDEIISRMQDFFQTLCPSVELSTKQFEAVVGSVIGFSMNYEVEMSFPDGSDITPIGALDCGYELGCDAVACLAGITFIDSAPALGAC